MDTLITTWEMNMEPLPLSPPDEQVASGPFEPYTLDGTLFNWN
jgi:hypothetical protein